LQCEACKGRFEPLSRQATQNAMGPWQVRDESQPFRPPCSYETIVKLAQRGKIGPTTIVRGPTTRQFWSYARDTPGVAAVLGFCHACHTPISADDAACPSCESVLRPQTDRQHLGLSPKAVLPGEAPPEQIAAMIRPRTPGAMPPAPVQPSPPRPLEPEKPAPERDAVVRVEPATDVAPVTVATRGKRSRSGLLKGVVAVQAVALVALTLVVVMQWQSGVAGDDGERVASGEQSPNEPTQPVPTDAGAEDEEQPVIEEPVAEEDGPALMDAALRPYADRYWAMVEGTRSDDAEVLERSIGQLAALREEVAAAEPGADFTLVDDLIGQAQQRLDRLRLIEEFGGRR
jgi:hypothetical protein